jgi:membrane fusion protein (multidrug efflux system)
MRLYLFSLFAFAFLVLSACGDEQAEPVNEVVRTNVRVKVVQPDVFANYLTTIGTVEAENDVPLIAEEGGTLTHIKTRKGSFARRGQAIALLDNPILQAQLRQARAAYLADSLSYVQQLELLDVNGISEVALKQAEYRRDMSFANYELLLQRVAKLRIKAPISGLLDNRNYDLGTYVAPMSVFGHLVDTRSVKIKVELPERYIRRISDENPVVVTFDAFPGDTIDAEIRFVGRVVSAQSRTFPIELVIANDEGRLQPNMVANVTVRLYQVENRLVIPKDAIVDQGTRQIAFVKKGDYALARELEIEDIYRYNALLHSGLRFGDTLIVEGNRDLVDSTFVRVFN